LHDIIYSLYNRLIRAHHYRISLQVAATVCCSSHVQEELITERGTILAVQRHISADWAAKCRGVLLLWSLVASIGLAPVMHKANKILQFT